jgi:tetratricopeptide (TPR) repeat protein
MRSGDAVAQKPEAVHGDAPGSPAVDARPDLPTPQPDDDRALAETSSGARMAPPVLGARTHRDSHTWQSGQSRPAGPRPVGRREKAPVMSMDQQPRISERFGILERVGRGGFGSVYRAFDHEMRRSVALKILHHEDGAARMELKREFRMLRRVPHPNVVRFHELFTDGECCFYTMDLVSGRPVDEWFAGRSTSSDLERLAHSLVGTVRAIHAAGAIHRDLKPANLLIDANDTLVVVDFGFATMARPDGRGNGDGRSGTLAYMATEAMLGRVVRASDWYSVGVVLYELAVGELPPQLASGGGLASKVSGACSRRGFDVPWLPALVRGLLAVDPAARERTATEFAGVATFPPALRVEHDDPARHRLYGRDAELAELQAQFDRSRSAGVVFELRGPSGIGKSEIAQRFVDRIADEGAVVLEGRCHTTERVPYNAVDGIVDDLARLLGAKLNAGEQASLATPEARRAAVAMFPVLRLLSGFDEGGEIPQPAKTMRESAVVALRDCLACAASMGPLVLFIEDVQWADGESAALLGDLLRAPAVPAFVLLAYQWPDPAGGAFLRAFDAPALSRHRLTLAPLDAWAVEQWVRDERYEISDATVRQIVARGEGFPYLLQELVRASDEGSATGLASFSDLLALRAGRLGSDERLFLEAALLAGLPIECATLADAAGLEGAGKLHAEYLAAHQFLKIRQSADGHLASAYHDQVRHALVSRMSEARRLELHLRLAESLQAHARDGTDMEPIFVHFLAAGREEHAGHYAELAGRHAMGALAFDRAARLCREAADLATGGADRIRRLDALGTALACDGRCDEAARCFTRASRLCAQLGSDWAEESRRLLLLAARHFARSGLREESRELLRELLEGVGLDLVAPASHAATSDRGLVRRFWRKRPSPARGGLFRSAAGAGLLWDATTMLWLDEPAAASSIVLQAGSRAGSDDAAALDFAAESLRSIPREASHASSSRPPDDAVSDLLSGIRLSRGSRWSDSLDAFARAKERLVQAGREHCAELTILRLFEHHVLTRSGRYAELLDRLAAEKEQARAAGDEYAACLFRAGEPSIALLAAEETAAVTREIELIRASLPAVPFGRLRARVATSEVLVLLYEGHAPEARKLLLETWDDLETCAAPGGHELPSWLRARTAIALLGAEGVRSRRSRNSDDLALLKDARVCARALRAQRNSCAAGFAHLVEASIARALSDDSGGRREAVRAADEFRACGMPVHAASCEVRAGGRAVRNEAIQTLVWSGVSNPERFARLLCG